MDSQDFSDLNIPTKSMEFSNNTNFAESVGDNFNFDMVEFQNYDTHLFGNGTDFTAGIDNQVDPDMALIEDNTSLGQANASLQPNALSNSGLNPFPQEDVGNQEFINFDANAGAQFQYAQQPTQFGPQVPIAPVPYAPQPMRSVPQMSNEALYAMMGMNLPEEVHPMEPAPASPPKVMPSFNPRIGWYYPAIMDNEIGSYLPAPGQNVEYNAMIAAHKCAARPSRKHSAAPVSYTPAPAPAMKVGGQRHKLPKVHKRSIIKECTCIELPEKIRRPQNAYILYRSHFAHHLTKADKFNQASVSKKASARWHTLTAEEKAPYYLMAEEEKQRHAQAHPDYQYSPYMKLAAQFGTPECKCGAYRLNIAEREARAGASAPSASVFKSAQGGNVNINSEGEKTYEFELDSATDADADADVDADADADDDADFRPAKRARTAPISSSPRNRRYQDLPVLDDKILEGIPEHQKAQAAAELNKKRKRGSPAPVSVTPSPTRQTRSRQPSPDTKHTIKEYKDDAGRWYALPNTDGADLPFWVKDVREKEVRKL